MFSVVFPPYARLAIYLFASCILAPALIKRAANSGRSEALILAQYAWLSTILLVLALATRALPDWRLGCVFAALGALNGLGAYAQWRSYAISLSLSSVALTVSGLLAVILDWLFTDAASPRPAEIFGSGLTFLAVAALLVNQSSRGALSSERLRDWLRWSAPMVVLTGAISFLLRWFASHGSKPLSFFAPYYIGAFASALGLNALAWGSRAKQTLDSPTQHLFAQSFVLALTIFMGSASYFWTTALLPLSVVQPASQLSGVLFPVLVGILLFGERHNFGVRSYVLLVAALIGVALTL